MVNMGPAQSGGASRAVRSTSGFDIGGIGMPTPPSGNGGNPASGGGGAPASFTGCVDRCTRSVSLSGSRTGTVRSSLMLVAWYACWFQTLRAGAQLGLVRTKSPFVQPENEAPVLGSGVGSK